MIESHRLKYGNVPHIEVIPERVVYINKKGDLYHVDPCERC